MGDPILREKAEQLLLDKIESLKKVLLSHPTLSAHFKEVFDNYHISVTSTERRSFANRVSHIACLSTERHAFMSNTKIFFEPYILIDSFGHEVLGHCANYHMSDNSNLPFFNKFGFFTLTSASREAVSEYKERKIFDYLKQSTKLVDLFDGEFDFADIEELNTAVALIRDYHGKMYTLGVWVLAHSKMDNAQEQIDELAKYSIEKKWPSNFVNRRRNDWNRATGLLLPNIVSELRYSVDVLSQDLLDKVSDFDEFELKVLQGMWTPEGMREFLGIKNAN